MQMVLSLSATETSSDSNTASDLSSDSEDEGSESEDDKQKNKRRRINKDKGKGRAPTTPKKNACLLHPKSKHSRFDCDKLKEVLRSARGGNTWQNKNNFAGTRSFFGSSRAPQYNNGAGPSNVNWCRFCHRVPYTRGHECQEMLRARRSNNNNNNNNSNNAVRNRMSHLSSQVE